jgi:putative ABC transport system permease protein
MKIFTLALSNAIVALAGSLFSQMQGFADISMGTGTVIVGLASVIIGSVIVKQKSILVAIISCVVGSIIYRLAIALALNNNSGFFMASDLNLITATLVAITMILPKLKRTKC